MARPMAARPKNHSAPGVGRRFVTSVRKYWFIYLLAAPGFVFLLLFSYAPMYGILLAFKDYKMNLGVWGSPWVGLQHYQELFSDPVFIQAFQNTIIINIYNLIFGFSFNVFLAMMINELQLRRVKSVVQTCVYLPYFLSSVLEPGIPSYHVRTLVEGLIRIGIFVLYILLISRMEDIQRTFMYHGAEHKCINCIEHGLPLTVENVRNSSRQHKRCGTSFLFFVLAISILLLFLIQVESTGMRVLIRILLLPVIAGISYEVLKLAGNSDNPLINLLSRPGLAIQKLTTKEPDDSMIEVAIQAVEAVFDWRAYERENFDTAADL